MKKRKILTYETLNSSINYDLGDKKLSLNHNDVKMNKSFIPISVSHIYQNNNYESKYGKGFKLNIEQKLYSDNGCYVIENPSGYKEKFNEIIYYLDNNGKRVYTRENGKKLTRDCITINNGVLEYNGNTVYIETKTDSGLILLNNYEGFSNSKDLELRNEDIASLEEEIKQIEDTLVDIKYNLNEYTKYSNTNYINMLEAQKDYYLSSQNLKQIISSSFDEILVEKYQDKKQEYLDAIAVSQSNVGGLYKNGDEILFDATHSRNTYSNDYGENAEKYNVKLSYEGDTQVFVNEAYIGTKVINVDKFENMSDDEKYYRYYNQVFNDTINKLNYELQQKSAELENTNYSYQKESYNLQLVNIDKENKYVSAKEKYEEEYLKLLKEYYNALIERSEYQIEYYNKVLKVKKYQLQMMYQQYPKQFVVNQEGLTYGYNKYGYLCMIFDSFEHQLLIEAEYDIDANDNVLSIKYLDIVDSNDNKVEFIYNEKNQLIRIINDNDAYIDYEYDNGYLVCIKYSDNEVYTLSYKNDMLYSIVDIDNFGYRVEYNDSLLSSITKIYNHDEFCIDETISYAYEANTVSVSSNKEKHTKYYLFNENNSLIIEYSLKNGELHNAITYEYDSDHCSFTMNCDGKKQNLLVNNTVELSKLYKTDYMLCAFVQATSDKDIKIRRITEYCSHIINDKNYKLFELKCVIKYPNYEKIFISSFNPKVDGLQFNAIPITLDEDETGKVIIPESITVSTDYKNNNVTVISENFAFLEGDFVYTEYDEAHNKTYESYSDTKALKIIDGQDSGYYITKKEIYYSYNYKNLLETQKEVVSYEEYDITNNLVSNIKKEYSINFIYDKNNKLVRSSDSLGNVEETTYNDIGVCILKRKYHKTLPNQAFVEETEVDENGIVLSETNELGFKNKYNYIKNTPVSVETPGGNIIAMNNSINSTTISTDIDGVENYNSSVYDKGRLVEYITNNMSYKYTYDYKGRESSLYINDKLYVSFEYIEDIASSKLSSKTIYTNGDGYEKITDLDGKILEINIITNYNASPLIKYQYDDNDNLINELHYENGEVLTYSYNYIDNTLISITTPYYTKTTNNDIYGNTIKFNYKLEDSEITYNNIYDENNKLTSIDYNNDNIQTISYDKINRVVNLENPVIKDNYNYLSKNGRTTNLVNINNKKIGNEYQRYKYRYDKEANITHKLENHNNTWYHYDKLNRLIREDNQALNQTIVYELDSNGNILSKTIYPYTTKEEINEDGIIIDYHYDNYNDILTSYNNELISYDDLGNPIIYRNNNLKWNIKQLTKFNDISFKYNVNGIRTEKITNDKSIKYILDGNKLLKEIITTYNSFENVTIDENSTISTAIEEITYIYGVNGIIGFDYKSNNITKRYYFNKNIFNDIIEIYDSNNNLVGKYEYDAYGNHKIITNIDNIANINPIRYRGYYYDKETNLYYLESRYYDPEVARFISMDSIEYLEPDNINGLNLYCYCQNNPISYYDPSGHSVILAALLIGSAVGLILGGIYGGVTAVANNQNVSAGVFIGSGVGLLMGAGAGVAALFLAPVVAGQAVVIGGLTYGTGAALAFGTGSAFISGFIGGILSDLITQTVNDGKVQDFGSIFVSGFQWGLINTANAFLCSLGGPVTNLESALLSIIFGSVTSAIGMTVDILRNRQKQIIRTKNKYYSYWFLKRSDYFYEKGLF